VALTVNTPPAISIPPQSTNVCTGAAATFTVVATGGGLTYQWQTNNVDITGATSSSYTTPATTVADNGLQFRCIVRPCPPSPATSGRDADQSQRRFHRGLPVKRLFLSVNATFTVSPLDQD
jgi:hypothetical protein